MAESTCNCDGTISIPWGLRLFSLSKVYEDDVLARNGITEDQFANAAASGATDPRPIACEQAVAQLRATRQDPCALDSPDDLQVEYKLAIPLVWGSIQGTPTMNPLQKAVDVAVGSADKNTPVTMCDQAEAGSLTAKLCGQEPFLSGSQWIGVAIAAAAVLFVVVFAATR